MARPKKVVPQPILLNRKQLIEFRRRFKDARTGVNNFVRAMAPLREARITHVSDVFAKQTMMHFAVTLRGKELGMIEFSRWCRDHTPEEVLVMYDQNLERLDRMIKEATV